MGGGEVNKSPSAALLAPGQGLEWKSAKAQTPSALPFHLGKGCCRGMGWDGNMTL